ncbi:MAG TPA: GNAT family N-acetyltransferase [Acidimicrobiales bacterium]|jgi:GNAT superfamily N-acetyltransferase
MEDTRLASEGDVPACRELLRVALEGAMVMRGGATLVGTATVDQLLARWSLGAPASPDATTAVYVGQFHQVVVGLAAVVSEHRPGAETPAGAGRAPLAGRIECLYVEPEARGVGVGSALMAAAVAWCRQQSCVEIDALALPGDRSSKQRYEGAGFTARLLTLSRKLD